MRLKLIDLTKATSLKYYEAYDERYKTVHAKGLSWAGRAAWYRLRRLNENLRKTDWRSLKKGSRRRCPNLTA